MPSGQYRFIKKSAYDRAKGAVSIRKKHITGKTTKKRRSPTRRKTSGGKRNMGKRNLTIPLPIVAGLAIGLAGPALALVQGDIKTAVNQLSMNYIGYHPSTGFKIQNLARGFVPLVIGMLVHKFAVQLGINRALGRAQIPFIRF